MVIKMTFWNRAAAIAACVAGMLLGAPGGAAAQRSVRGEVLVVLAKEAPGRIDNSLSSVMALRRAPFNSFRTMEVLSRPRIELPVGQPVMVELPNGRRLKVVLEQVMPDGRYRVRVSINRPNQQDYLPLLQVVASPGDPFFVAGQSFKVGTLVIGVQLGQRAANGG